LVRLNLANPAVKEHLFQAVTAWVRDFAIDGLRLDVADDLEPAFMQELSAHCRALKEDFWLMGEVIHGDYRGWVNAEMLQSVTNYELYKGLFSSHVDSNYFEIAYSLNRQFGESGMYQGLPLYTFADNHDVDRVASSLTDPSHLFPLYTLLFTVPGVPSIYSGSEWGIQGKRTPSSDQELRPALDLSAIPTHGTPRSLMEHIAQLARVRRASPALKYGSYRPLHVDHQQFAFLRQREGQAAVIAVNASALPAAVEIDLPDGTASAWTDALQPGETVHTHGRKLSLELAPYQGKIMLDRHLDTL
jgi:cyclomaltodextrinase / maltogenic alpha-amylase / neopullulanase